MTGKSHQLNDISDGEMIDTQTNNYDSDEEGGLRIDGDIYIPPPPKRISEIDSSEPRLMIKQIVIENFKSYAGRQVLGPFHKRFSSVIGANGSGKSNVIDSILFVFGYRATKIRSKKVSVLVHNSSEHPNCTSCTVSIYFHKIIDKPGEDYDVVPNSEIVISRTAHKDNSSYYELNKKKVHFKEIARVLRSHNVDLDHNRFLILQGEVEQIAMMKPKGQNENDAGMLEFLEDIIGTVCYKEPLEKLSERVEIVMQCRAQKLNRLRIAEQEKAALEEPMQKAVQYLHLENSVKKLEHELYHCKRYAVEKDASAQEEKLNEINTDLSKLLDEMKEVQQQKENKNKELKEANKISDALQAKKNEVAEKFDKVRKKDEYLHAELIETNKRRKSNMASLKTEKSKLEELLQVPEKSAKDIKECEDLIQRDTMHKEREEKALATLMSKLQEKTKPLLEERSKLETELISFRNNVDDAKGAHDIAQSELELYMSLEKTETEKLEKLRNTLESTSVTLTERKKQLSSFKAKIPASEASLKQAETELNAVKQQEFETMNNLKKMRISFEEKRSAMQQNRSRNRILDALMREKREGRLPGVLGRLGDLGAIDARYDVAVSTACGPLDNIVVDTVNTAEACILFLRQNDLGRATFIPLEKQQRFLEKCKEKIQTPENVPRLFDLIKVENPQVLPAFYYALQDTLVAQDIDQATRVAYGTVKYRVVTLKGELIELSGTMSGGGRTMFKGRMGQKVMTTDVSAEDIEKLQTELDREYEKCNELKGKQQTLENQIHTLSMALKDMKLDQNKFSIEVQALTEQEPKLRSQLKVQEEKCKEVKSDPKKIKQLTKIVEDAKKHLDAAKEKAENLETEVQDINKRINEISGNRVEGLQKKITSLTKAIDKAKTEICRLQVGVKTAERNVKKTQQRIETLENDVTACEQKLRNFQDERKHLEVQATELTSELNKLTEELKEKDTTATSSDGELKALQMREDKMKSLKIDIDQKIKENKKVLQELKQKISIYEAKIANLKLNEIPGEQIASLPELTEDQIKEINENTILHNLQKAKDKLPSNVPNMQCVKDYFEKDILYQKRAAEAEEISIHYKQLRDTLDTLKQRRIHEFIDGFSLITNKLKEMYRMITLGGDAELELVDSLDPFSEGVVFSVRPPKKSWKNISNLSGGEKTLSSLALVFALHHYKPTPFYFMDEIDAALDTKNVSIVANYIKDRTKNAQFIVISLRENMFELADYLVGIYKTFNCSKSITVDVKKYYDSNNLVPPTQLTSRCLYGSQRLTSSQYHTQVKESIPQNKVTSSEVTEDNTVHPVTGKRKSPVPNAMSSNVTEENNEKSSASNTLQLPELGLCPTPKKSVQTRSSRGKKNDEEDNTIKEPPSKRKKHM